MSQITVNRSAAFVMLIGVIYTIVGFAYASGAAPNPTDNQFAAALRFAPIEVWGGIWLVAGLGSVAVSLSDRYRIWSYAILEAWSSFWAVMCFGSTLFYDSDRGWMGGLIWATFAGAVAIVAGMRDTP